MTVIFGTCFTSERRDLTCGSFFPRAARSGGGLHAPPVETLGARARSATETNPAVSHTLGRGSVGGHRRCAPEASSRGVSSDGFDRGRTEDSEVCRGQGICGRRIRNYYGIRRRNKLYIQVSAARAARPSRNFSRLQVARPRTRNPYNLNVLARPQQSMAPQSSSPAGLCGRESRSSGCQPALVPRPSRFQVALPVGSALSPAAASSPPQ